MANTTYDKFMDSYRALDRELNAEGMKVIEYENTLTGVDQERLKVCRIMRNYSEHNETDFLTMSVDQIKFLDKLTDNVRKSSHIVKDEMKRIKTVKATEKMANLIVSVDKNMVVPVESSSGLFLLDKNILLHQLAQGNKKLVVPTRLPKYKYVSPTTRIDTLSVNSEGKFYIVTKDGTATGAYMGILIW